MGVKKQHVCAQHTAVNYRYRTKKKISQYIVYVQYISLMHECCEYTVDFQPQGSRVKYILLCMVAGSFDSRWQYIFFEYCTYMHISRNIFIYFLFFFFINNLKSQQLVGFPYIQVLLVCLTQCR